MAVRVARILSSPESLRLDALAVGPAGVAVGATTGEVLVARDDGLHGVRGHTFAVTALAFARDGRLASASIDGRVRVWAPDLALLFEHAGPAPILRVGWLGDVVVAGDGDGGVWIGAVRHPGHDGPVTALVVHREDLWTAGADGRIRRWTRDGARDELPRHPVAIDALAVGDGEVLAGTGDGTVFVHGDRPRRWVCGTSEVFWIARSAVGIVAATTDGQIHVEGRDRFGIGTDGVFPVALDPDGERVWVVTVEGARGWWLATGAPSAVLAPAAIGHRPARIAVTSDRIRAAGGGLAAWPRPHGDDGALDHVGYVRGSVPWGDDVVSHGNDGAVVLRDVTGAGRRLLAMLPGICWSVAVSPDGRRLATGTDDAVTAWERDGTRVGTWSTPGHAVRWLDDERLVAGGGPVRLATMALAEPDVRILAAAGTQFTDQTQRLDVLPDGRVVAASTVGTAGTAFDLATGAMEDVTVAPWSRPDTGVAVAREANVAPVVGPPIRGDRPPLPDEAGPAWLRSWLAGALHRTCSPRSALAHALRKGGFPADPAVVAWEAGHGSYRVVSTLVGHGAMVGDRRASWIPPVGPPRLRVGEDWPSRFHADADGGLWERSLGVDRRIGALSDLAPLLALRAAAGSPVARLVVDALVGDAVAAAVSAAPVAVGTTRWWLGPAALVSEDDGRTEVAASSPKAVAAAVRVLSAPTRITSTGTVKIAALAEAPPMPIRPPDALPLAPGATEGFVDRGPPVRQVEGRDGRQVEVVTVGKATTRWVRLTGEGPTALSASARAWLAVQKAERDPRATAAPDALAALLTRRGFRVHDGVLAAERAFGGLRFRDPEAPSEPWFALGAWQYLSLWPLGWTFRAEDVARGLVPFVSGPGDSVYAVDADGRLWWQEMVAMPAPVVVASSPTVWVERIVRQAEAPRIQLEVDGHHGAAVAERLGASPVPEATDAVEAWWVGDGLAVTEPFDGQAALDGEPAKPRTRVGVSKAGVRAATAVLAAFGEVRRPS